jgi:o-succinylbenzoate---CoA ligase
VPALVALDLAPGPRFVELLRRVWDAGDAVAPLDHRLSGRAAQQQVDSLRPTAIMGEDGERRALDGGLGTEPGDALVLCTSGSTGAPKAAVLTHDAVAASAWATSDRLGVRPGRDRWLACLPLAHIGGLAVVTRALVTETPLEVLPGFDAAAVARCARLGATLVSLVATALDRIDPALFRTVVLGGAAPPGAVAPNVVTTYGMTETGSGVVYDGVALAGVDVAIAGEPGEAEGRAGEILVRGSMLLRTYRDGTDPRRSGGWFATGDAGELDAQGRLRVLGRIAEVIVTGGEKVWPTDVEAVLRDHPDVADVAVVGSVDSEWGQRVVAHVVPTDPGTPPALSGLQSYVRDHLPPWAAPRQLIVHVSLPRTASGKVARARLVTGSRTKRGGPSATVRPGAASTP